MPEAAGARSTGSRRRLLLASQAGTGELVSSLLSMTVATVLSSRLRSPKATWAWWAGKQPWADSATVESSPGLKPAMGSGEPTQSVAQQQCASAGKQASHECSPISPSMSPLAVRPADRISLSLARFIDPPGPPSLPPALRQHCLSQAKERAFCISLFDDQLHQLSFSAFSMTFRRQQLLRHMLACSWRL